MKTVRICLCIALLAAGGEAVQRRHSSRRPVLRNYIRKVFSPEGAARAGASAAVNQGLNHPHEWGSGAPGFGKRLASAFGQHVVSSSIEFGVGALHHEDLRYHPSHRKGTWPRLKYVVKSTFVVPRTDRRGHTVAAGRIAGSLGGGLISRAWQPASTAGLGLGVASGGIALGADVGLNAAREFWPRHKHRLAAR